MTDVIDIILRIKDQGSGTVKEVTKELKNLDSEAQGVVSRGLSGLQTAIGTGLKAAVAVGLTALTGFGAAIGDSIGKAADLEQQAANISAVFGDMAPPIEDVKGLISDLSLDEKLVVGIEDAGEGLQMLAQNGLTWDEIAQGAARSSILLANATGADLATSADITTNALGIFGLEVENLDSVVATFVNSANKSQFGVEDWGLALANAGPKAAAFGIKLEDLFAAMTLTSSGFSSGQTMGTSWGWMLSGLVPNTEKAEDAMKELGLITTDYERMATHMSQAVGREVPPTFAGVWQAFQETQAGAEAAAKGQDALGKAFNKLQSQYADNQFFDEVTGEGKELDEVIRLLQDSFGELDTEQQMAYSRTIFGGEAYGALAGVLQLNREELNALIPQMTDFGAVEAGAATRTDTYQAAMSALFDTISAVQTMIGDKFLPVLTDMARGFANLLKDNAGPIIDWFGVFATRLADFIPLLGNMTALFEDGSGLFAEFLKVLGVSGETAQMVGRYFYDFIESIKAIAQPIVGLVTQFVSWKDLVTAVGVVIASIAIPAIAGLLAAITPVVGVFAALVGASALLRTAWENDWLGIRSTLESVWGIISGVFNAVMIKVGAIVDWFKIQWAVLDATNADLGTRLATIWNTIKDLAYTVWQGIVTTVQILWPRFVEAVTAWGSAAWQWIAEVTPIAWAKLQEWGTGLWQWLTANLPTWIENLKGWAMAAWQWIADAVPVALTTLGNWLGGIISWLGANLPNFLKTILEWGTALYTWIGDAIPKAIDGLANFIKGIREKGEGEGKTSFGGMVRGWVTTLWRWIVDDLIPAVGPAFMDFVGAMLTYGGKLLVSLGNLAKELGLLLWQWIVDAMGPAGKKIAEWGGMLWGWLKDNAPEWGRKLAQWGTAAWEWIVNATGPAIKKLGEWGAALWEWLKQNAPIWAEKLGEWAGIAWQWITKTAIPEATKKLGEWGAALWDWLKENAPIWGERLAEWAAIAWEWIRDVAIPVAIEKLGEWGKALWAWIKENAPIWREKLGEWAKAAWEWIVNEAIPIALEKLGEWGAQLWGWVKEQAPKWASAFLQAGRDIIQGLWDGLKERWQSLSEWFGGVWGGLVDRFKNFFGIASPSRLMFGYGQDIMSGLQMGVHNGGVYVKQTLEDMSVVWQNIVTKRWIPDFSAAGQAMGKSIGAGLKSEAEWIAEQINATMKRANDEMLAGIEYFTNQAVVKAQAAHYKIANATKDAAQALKDLGIDTSKVIGYGPNGELILAGITNLPRSSSGNGTVSSATGNNFVPDTKEITTLGQALGADQIAAQAGATSVALLGGITLEAIDLKEARENTAAAVTESAKTVQDFIAGFTDFLKDTLTGAQSVFGNLKYREEKAYSEGELKEFMASETYQTKNELKGLYEGIKNSIADILGISSSELNVTGADSLRLIDRVGQVLSGTNLNTNMEFISTLLQDLVNFRSLSNFGTGASYYDSALPTDARLTGGNTTNTYNINLMGTSNASADLMNTVQLLNQLGATAVP